MEKLEYKVKRDKRRNVILPKGVVGCACHSDLLLRFEQHVTDCKHMRRACHMQFRLAIGKRRAPLPILWGVYWLFRALSDFRTAGRFVERIRRCPCYLWVRNTYRDRLRHRCSYVYTTHFRTDESTRPDSSRAIPDCPPFHGWSMPDRRITYEYVTSETEPLSMIHSMILDTRLSPASAVNRFTANGMVSVSTELTRT